MEGLEGQDLRRLGRQDLQDLAVRSVPPRAGLFGTELNRQQQLAGGSPGALYQTLLPQMTSLRQLLEGAFTQLNRRLGPNAGKQLDAARGGAVRDAGLQLQKLFAGGQRGGLQQLFQMLSGLQLGVYPAPTQTVQQPFNPSGYVALGQNLGRAIGTYNTQGTIAGFNVGGASTSGATSSGNVEVLM